jgi:hypothetical protein
VSRAPTPTDLLDVRTLVFRPAGRAPRFLARGAFVTATPPDPSATGLVLEFDAADGTPLYRAALAAAAFHTGPRRRRFRWTAALGDRPLPSAAGLRRVIVRLAGPAVHVFVVGRDPALAGASAEPRLGWVVRFGEACARNLDLACAPAPLRALRCR